MGDITKRYTCPKCKQWFTDWSLPIPKNKTFDEAHDDKSIYQCQKCKIPYKDDWWEYIKHIELD